MLLLPVLVPLVLLSLMSCCCYSDFVFAHAVAEGTAAAPAGCDSAAVCVSAPITMKTLLLLALLPSVALLLSR